MSNQAEVKLPHIILFHSSVGRCEPNIDLQFNERSLQLWNVTIANGQGLFDGKTTMVSIKNLANHYAHDFAVRVSMKANSHQDMILFENSDCQETALPSIKVFLRKTIRPYAIIAEIKTAHGVVKVQLQSMVWSTVLIILINLVALFDFIGWAYACH